MTIAELINDKSLKAKAKVQALGNAILDKTIKTTDLIQFAITTSETNKATCIESLEFATKQEPSIADNKVFDFVIESLQDNAPRVKWESAKVTGNIAHLFPAKLDKPISYLLNNAENDGTVVRWATAYALGEILKLKTKHNKELLPAIEAICKTEEDNGVKKKYLDAIKKATK